MSRWTSTERVAVPPSDVASHVIVVPAVSALIVTASQPALELISDSAS